MTYWMISGLSWNGGGRMKRTTMIAGITFVGAAAGCVFATSSYPIAIWGVGFAAIYKLTHPHTGVKCPILEAAAAREGERLVVDTDARQVYANQPKRRTHAG